MISPPLGEVLLGSTCCDAPWHRGQMLSEWLCITEEGGGELEVGEGVMGSKAEHPVLRAGGGEERDTAEKA